jgi:hypothetical protein
MEKPKCPICKSRKWINTMVKGWSGIWFLCSKCGADNYHGKWQTKEISDKCAECRGNKPDTTCKYYVSAIVGICKGISITGERIE